MALTPMYFQPLSPQQANPMLYGMGQGAAIAGQQQQNLGRMLQNYITGQQVPYAGQMAQATLANTQAQAPYINSQTALNMGTLPYLGMKFAGPYYAALAKTQTAYNGAVNSLNNISSNPALAAQIPNHPEIVQGLLRAGQNQSAAINNGVPGMMSNSVNPVVPPLLSSNQSTAPQVPNIPFPQAGYANPVASPNGHALPQTIPMQTLPQTPAQIQKLKQLFPTSTSQQDIDAANNAVNLQVLKKTTDPMARQKALLAANIDKTIGMINPDDLTQYAGGMGGIEKALQTGLASSGLESKNFDNYKQSENAAEMLATQVRQFYGDSIQPSVREELQELTNPATWSNNPALAKRLFNNLKNILGQETSTYRDALQSTAPYQGQSAQPQAASNPIAPSASKVLNGMTYHKINGQWYAQ